MKKIAVNTVKTFLKEHKREDVYTKTFNVVESSFDVVFHMALTVAEKSTFINRVLRGCFDSTGKFRPEYVTPMLRATILQVCTNVPAITLKNERDDGGAPVLDIDAMNDLYVAMDLDHLDNPNYQQMMGEMVQMCMQAIDWKRNYELAEHRTDAALRNFLTALTAKVENTDISDLMQYAGVLSEATKGLGEGDILKGLLKAKDIQTK